MCVCVQVQSEFILESERESFIEQVREVIENADEKGLERDANSQVNTTLLAFFLLLCGFSWGSESCQHIVSVAGRKMQKLLLF